MAVFKCKMCGGSLNVPEGITVCECEYCGTTQTLPKTDNEQNLNMINRANHFRQQCEFDKAMEIYERLLNHSDNDSEIYWSIVLCRYGIEYVDDPMTQKKIPTCHRTQFKSILEDTDYIEAISHADVQQKVLYQNEAQYIDNVQKGILEISNKEDPFDVFICYKESDENGKRTPDSVLAQELYYQLTREGFKVFFSRITLEDKLGTAYEPYIFAALNSSKVMVVVGTKPEYFNAVWVRNEWSRFLMLMQNDRSKILIPAYRDMDPYDLPDALSMFQAQDMSKLGFMQDLLHGIEKIVKADTRQPIISETIVKTVPVNSNVENLIKRGMLSLEDEKWDEANEFFEQVLNENVEEPRAYLGKLMAELKMSSEDNLSDLGEDFSDRSNYKKAFRFGDEAFKKRIQNYNFLSMYNGACLKMSTAKNEDDYRKVKELFLLLGDFSDSVEKVNECEEKIKECEEKAKEYVYKKICDDMEKVETESQWFEIAKRLEKLNGYKDSNERQGICKERAADAHNYLIYKSALSICQKNEDVQEQLILRRVYDVMDELENAITKYESIKDYRDSEEKIEWCRRKIEEIKIADENRKKELEFLKKRRRNKNKKIAMLTGGVCVVGIVFVIIFNVVIVPYNKYKNAVELYKNEKYDEAILTLEEVGEYKDSKSIIYEAKYKKAVNMYNEGRYSDVALMLEELNENEDSSKMLDKFLDEMVREPFKKTLKESKIGDEIKFHQEYWIVLEKKNNRVLVIERRNVHTEDVDNFLRQYNSSNENVTWESCTLRKWLNEDYYNSFTEIEKEFILETEVANSNSPNLEIEENNTIDKIFLLSIDEVEKYMDQHQRWFSNQKLKKIVNWWLRSSGDSQNIAAYVDKDGNVNMSDFYVDYYAYVRPAMWLSWE